MRVEDALWVPALTIAEQLGENLSDIIRAAIRDYINKHQGEKLWAEYQEATTAAGLNASETIRQLIQDWLNNNEGEK